MLGARILTREVGRSIYGMREGNKNFVRLAMGSISIEFMEKTRGIDKID